MSRTGRPNASRNKLLVVIALVGTVVFGTVLGLLLWSNDSFPAETRQFSQYASVESSTFNGTEFSFSLKWFSSDYLPLYAQLSSQASDTATTDVCNLNLTTVSDGQTVLMPFGLSGPSSSLSDVDLSVAVKSVANGTEFTIVYNTPSITATPGDIQPQNLACAQNSAPP